MVLDEPHFIPTSGLRGLRRGLPENLRLEGLWAAGDLSGLGRSTVAVVGCRAASDAGRRRARAIARGLAEAGVCVISGLAMGIDAGAHAGALAGGGATVGVLGGGHRCFFPRRNRALAEAMVAGGGAVVSPYAPDAPAFPFQFLQRNAVIVALCDAVVVVEAAARSGALNTARWAGDSSVAVFAVPGDVDRPKAAGCNALIRDGAVLVRDAADVLAGIGLASLADRPADAPPRRLDARDAALLRAVTDEPGSLDELLQRLGGEPGALLAALVRLELAGLLTRREDLRFARP